MRKRAYPTSPEPGPSTSMVREEPNTPQKKKLKRKLFREVLKSKEKTRKIRVLGQSLKRYKRKVVSLKHIVKDLQNKNLLSSENSILLENMTEINREILQRKTAKRAKYSPQLRKFAITLSFFSSKAYDYVRREFDTCLPHRSTIGKWFKGIDATPGFTTEAFETLKKQVDTSDKQIICSLVIDEMAIRKQLEWTGKKVVGYVNFGVDFEDDSNVLAKEVFVLMLVCINGSWKIPLGYFLTDSLSGDQKSSIVTQCIKLAEETGVKIVSLTCDGPTSNITMGKMLGCSFEFPEIKTTFQVTDHNIHFFLDPCHMIKLVRNTFGDRKMLIDGDGRYIKWEYIQKLNELQESEGLHLGNKLRRAHLNFFKQKMKVKLAVQLLSESVADSLQYCNQNLGLKEFFGCEGTVIFIKIINRIFDILNSRSLAAPGFKKALFEKNIESITEFAHDAITYLSNLKFADNNELVVYSRRKTGFLGLIVGLKSGLELYNDLVRDHQLLSYIPLYKVSQDHLELFFSSIRSRGGWNNNPTAQQFMGSYKRLLVRSEIREGGMGNCVPLEQINVLVCSSRNHNAEISANFISPRLIDNSFETEENLENVWKDHEYIFNNKIMSDCSLQIVTYIAGFVSKSLQKSVKCETCIQALIGNKANFLNSLIAQKSHGGLMYPSEDVVKICQKSEHFLRVHSDSLHQKNLLAMLSNKVISYCIEINIFKCLKNHALENPNSHIYFLTKAVCMKYLSIRIHFIVKMESKPDDPVRSKLTKLILFKGQ